MPKKSLIIFLLLNLIFSYAGTSAEQVVLKTNYGIIKIELFTKESPITTDNFKRYVKAGLYDGTIVHRINPEFVIQGGGFTKSHDEIETFDNIKNEATNGLKNLKGTLAMARYNNKDSASSQFFFNLKDNPHLDHRNDTNSGYGYAVFAKVVEGFEVLEAMQKIPTAYVENMGDAVPAYPVIIQQVSLN